MISRLFAEMQNLHPENLWYGMFGPGSAHDMTSTWVRQLQSHWKRQ